MNGTFLKFSTGLACLASIGLTACGGGGGGGESPAPGTGDSGQDLRQLQGRWQLATPATTGILVADGTGSATAWLLAQDASRLVKLTLNASGNTTGSSYDLATAGGAAINVSGTYAAQPAATPASLSLSSGGGTQVYSRSDALAGMASQVDAAGTWTASAGAAQASWTLGDTGAISGSSSTGCTYGGNTRTPTDLKVYRVEFSETCSGTTRSFAGVATLNAEKNRLTIAATTVDGGQGLALFFSKP